MRIRICVVVLLSMSMCLQSRAFSQGQREIVGDGKGRLVSQPVNVVSSVPEAAAYLSGVSELEQIPEEEMEKWWDLAEHPVPINLVGRNVLEASGLMSMYQIVSLLDYRARSGGCLVNIGTWGCRWFRKRDGGSAEMVHIIGVALIAG